MQAQRFWRGHAPSRATALDRSGVTFAERPLVAPAAGALGVRLSVDWTERGGPPVRAPERRGFGSTIIERSIRYELRGAAEIHYRLGGVEARFVIPQRFVRAANQGKTMDKLPGDGKESAVRLETVPGHVLVVEDSLIIAMDTEDNLRGLGVATVTTAGSVAAALASIDIDPPDLAILDYNLGNETSDPIAEVLRSRGIPFVLATGYGELAGDLEKRGAFALLKKPYGLAEIEELLAQPAG